jgi:hypothetical protein
MKEIGIKCTYKSSGKKVRGLDSRGMKQTFMEVRISQNMYDR